MKSLLTKPSNVLPFYTSSQNSNLLYSEVDSLKRSQSEPPLKKINSNRGMYIAKICCYAPQSAGMRNIFAITQKCYNSKDTNSIKRHNTLKSTFAKNKFASVIKHDTSAAKKFYFKLKLVTKMSYQQLVIYFFQI